MRNSTQEQAKKAADKLLMEGVRPTQQNVRAELGSGSITTINKALNDWWAELGDRLKTNTSHPMIPDPVAESASKIWVQALAYAEKHLEERRGALEDEYKKKAKESFRGRDEDHKELKELRAQCLRLLQESEKTQTAKHELQLKLAEGENRILSLQAESDRLRREVKQLEALGNSGNLDDFIELKVTNRTLKEENKRLNKQIDILVNEKSSLMLDIARLEQDNQL
ncbi:MAG: DNA-binding protein [Neptuniibacter sp.]